MFPKRHFGNRYFLRRYFPPTLENVMWRPVDPNSGAWNPESETEGIWVPIPNPGGFNG